MKNKNEILYSFFRPIFTAIFKLYYNPIIINKKYIPKEGKVIIAGNHKHAFDPIFVDSCTKRVVHTLAKKDLHDGKFGWLFKAVGTIPVDLKAEHNKEALNTAIKYLNNERVINISLFKYGTVIMAQRTNSKIIPYAITGDYKFRSKNLKIVFGEPLDVSKLDVEEANQILYETIKKLIIDSRNEEK